MMFCAFMGEGPVQVAVYVTRSNSLGDYLMCPRVLKGEANSDRMSVVQRLALGKT